MTSALQEQVDLAAGFAEWLEGLPSSEHGDACSTRNIRTGANCDREAVYEIRWIPDSRVDISERCRCPGGRRSKNCLPHGEKYMALITNNELQLCGHCEGFMIPSHIDKIRRSS